MHADAQYTHTPDLSSCTPSRLRVSTRLPNQPFQNCNTQRTPSNVHDHPYHNAKAKPLPKTHAKRAYFFGYVFFFLCIFFGTFSVFFLGRQHVPYILDGFRAISLGFPKKTLIPFFLEANATQEGRKEESKETRKEEGRKEGRKQGSKEAGKQERRKDSSSNNNMHTKSSSNTNNK